MRRALKRLVGFRGMARVRGALNRLTRGRVGLYSTAEHYSSGPSARILGYYQYDGAKEISCPCCSWAGTGDTADTNSFEELFDVRCPRCDQMLLIVGFPTLAEIERAASGGNEAAQRELARIRAEQASES